MKNFLYNIMKSLMSSYVFLIPEKTTKLVSLIKLLLFNIVHLDVIFNVSHIYFYTPVI